MGSAIGGRGTTAAELALVLWCDGLGQDREAVVRRRIGNLGAIRLVVRGGVLAVLDHEVQALVRSWPEVRLVGALTVGPHQAGSASPPPTERNTTRAMR